MNKENDITVLDQIADLDKMISDAVKIDVAEKTQEEKDKDFSARLLAFKDRLAREANIRKPRI